LRQAGLVAAAALALLPAGCGGDDEKKTGTAGGGQQTAARTETGSSRDTDTTSTPTTTARTTPKSNGGGKHGPEDQPGGAGDEVPARSLTLFTGRGGRISPRVVRVAPFISVRVELRSADGRSYSLRIGGKRLAAGGPVGSKATTLDGLRAGRAYVGRGSDGSRIRIEANAEPGP
jgi:hypothetical protein